MKIDLDSCFPWDLTIRLFGKDWPVPPPTIAMLLADAERPDVDPDVPSPTAEILREAKRTVGAIFAGAACPPLERAAWPDLVAIRTVYKAYVEEQVSKKRTAVLEMVRPTPPKQDPLPPATG